MPQLLQVSRVSKRNASLIITLPKDIPAKLGVKVKDFVGFYEEDGKIILKKIEWDWNGHYQISGYNLNFPDEFKVDQQTWMIPGSHH